MEHTREAPWLVLERLDIHNLHEQEITRLCGFHLEWPGQVVYLGQIHFADIICAVVVADLAASPVDAFDLLDGVSVMSGMEGRSGIKTLTTSPSAILPANGTV